MNDRAGIVALAALVLLALGSCLLIDIVFDGHYFVTELAIAATGIGWLTLLADDVLRAQARERELVGLSSPRVFGHIRWFETSALERDAIVTGALRPRIYVGSEFASALSEAELEAVLLHEDHHRRTWAPLRASALCAWLLLFGRIGPVRRVLLERLAGLEVAADRHALQAGCSTVALARALLKSDPCGLGVVAYSQVVAIRVGHLVNASRESRSQSILVSRLQHEWTPIPTLILVATACHYLV